MAKRSLLKSQPLIAVSVTLDQETTSNHGVDSITQILEAAEILASLVSCSCGPRTLYDDCNAYDEQPLPELPSAVLDTLGIIPPACQYVSTLGD